MAEHGIFIWNELMTRDVSRARDFYGKSLGWSFSEMPMGEEVYVVASAGDTQTAGIFAMAGPEFEGVPEHWMCSRAGQGPWRRDFAPALRCSRCRPDRHPEGSGRRGPRVDDTV
jgi:catechol 2,3-dioxygenase-like lactoylglutathione lyase family enzyme